MTDRVLDVGILPFEQIYTCVDGSKIDMSEFLERHYEAIQALASTGLIKSNESFGFAMAAPRFGRLGQDDMAPPSYWDEPEKFVWFVGGWGPESERYIANAVRKLRALKRYFDESSFLGTEVNSSLDMRFITWEKSFQDEVPSTVDGVFPWGDFPYGGAVRLRVGDVMTLDGAVSALSEIEDESIARLILGGLSGLIIKGSGGVDEMLRNGPVDADDPEED